MTQGKIEPIEGFVRRLMELWEKIHKALNPEYPPKIMKKDSLGRVKAFIAVESGT